MGKYNVILDCYTDEPAGLGVPPYIGTYPRYIAGALSKEFGEESVKYITIDDLRLHVLYAVLSRKHKQSYCAGYSGHARKTDIRIKNLSKNYENISNILANASCLVVIAGVHTPGKYLSAIPGTMHELKIILQQLQEQGPAQHTHKHLRSMQPMLRLAPRCKKILAGPAAEPVGNSAAKSAANSSGGFAACFSIGSRSEGGKRAEGIPKGLFDEIDFGFMGINDYSKVADYAVRGAFICRQHPDFSEVSSENSENFLMAELETGRGCSLGKCSFCTEPLKNRLEFREQKDILAEAAALRSIGIKNFRLGKQSCFYSYKLGKPDEIRKLLKPISELKPEVLHIDNAAPRMVTEEITKLIVEFCTPGNVAALGIESFDEKVIKANNLSCTPEEAMNAIKIINKYGKIRGGDGMRGCDGIRGYNGMREYNGMPSLLPGINLIFGLIGETTKTHDENMRFLREILDKDLWLRRINIRQVAIYPGTPIEKLGKSGGLGFWRKNKKYYWKWKNQIRQEIDLPMLRKVIPEGTILTGLRTEVRDGNTVFCRQTGSYPIIVGIKHGMHGTEQHEAKQHEIKQHEIKQHGTKQGLQRPQRLELNRTISARITSHMLRSVVGEVVEN